MSPSVVGPTTGGTSEGFRFQKLAEKSEDMEGANGDGVNSFSNPNYEEGTKTETDIVPAPTVFGKLVSVEEVKETEDSQESDGKVDRSDEIKDEVGRGKPFFMFVDRQKCKGSSFRIPAWLNRMSITMLHKRRLMGASTMMS